MRERNKKQNMGFSLIEMVVVLAVMMILGVGVMTALPMLGGQQVRRAVRTIDTMLSNTKTTVMAKGTGYFQIRQESDGSYTAISADGREKPLGSRKGIKVTYRCSGSDVDYAVAVDSPLILTFDKASGAFLERVTAIDPEGDGSVACTYDKDHYVRSITVSLGDRQRTVTLYPKTGKYEVE